MFPYNIAASLVFGLLSIHVIRASATFPSSGTSAIGSGYWPSLLGWMLLFLAVGLLLETLVRRVIAKRRARGGALGEGRAPFAFASKGMRCVYYLCGAFIVFSVILYYANFIVASLFFIPACMRVLGEKRLPMLLAVTAGVPVCVYVIFEKVLGIPLPTGVFL